MVELDEHLKAVVHNKDFLDYVEDKMPPFEDWGVTVLFYIALHCLQAYFAKEKKHPPTHHNI